MPPPNGRRIRGERGGEADKHVRSKRVLCRAVVSRDTLRGARKAKVRRQRGHFTAPNNDLA